VDAVPSPLTLSVIVPLHNVQAYLPQLFDSFALQTPGDYTLEYIFVDDGSTDDSADMAEAWLAGQAAPGQLIRQPNRGVSAARNAGLAAATGDWVTFPDSDDFLDVDYFARVAKHLANSATARLTLLSTNIVLFREATGRFEDSHGLKAKFAQGSRAVRLADDPTAIQCSVASAFFPRAALERSGVLFGAGPHASEDALFTAQVLLADPDPVIGLAADARYYYRRRAAGDSATQTYGRRRDSFIDRFTGYLELARAVDRRGGGLPRWLTHQFLYELTWPYDSELDLARRSLLSAEDTALVINLTARLCAFADPRWIRTYDLAALTGELRSLFLALRGESLADQPVWVEAWDGRRRQVLLRYLFAGPPPAEDIRVDGRPAPPAFGKIVGLDYFDQTTVRERRLWVSLGEPAAAAAPASLSVRLDGQPRELRFGRGGRAKPVGGPGTAGVNPDPKAGATLTAAAIAAHFATPRPPASTVPLRRPPALPQTTFTDQAKVFIRQAGLGVYDVLNDRFPHQFSVDIPSVTQNWNAIWRNWPRRLAVESPAARARYADAWVLLDNVSAAGGPAEALYEHLRKAHPDQRCYFVLDPAAPDWARLAGRGFRLVPFRSLPHLSLFRHAAHIVVSGRQRSLVRPAPYAEYPYPLAHSGVLAYLYPNLSPADAVRLNQWDVDLIVCRPGPDHAALTGDGTPYRLTPKEVVAAPVGAWEQVCEGLRWAAADAGPAAGAQSG
jgi:glycosyltransferase involved in cell wall biosynthesis